MIGHPHRTFTYYVSHCLIYFTTQSTFTFGLSFVCFCLYCICPNGLFLYSHRDSVFHSHFSSSAASSIWLKNCPCNFFYLNTLLCSFLLLSLNSSTRSIDVTCCSLSPFTLLAAMSSPHLLIHIFQALEQPTLLSYKSSPASFLDKYTLATSHIGFNVQCINVLVLLSVCSNSALFNLEKQQSILVMKLCIYSCYYVSTIQFCF